MSIPIHHHTFHQIWARPEVLSKYKTHIFLNVPFEYNQANSRKSRRSCGTSDRKAVGLNPTVDYNFPAIIFACFVFLAARISLSKKASITKSSILAHSRTRSHYISLTRLALYWVRSDCRHLLINDIHILYYIFKQFQSKTKNKINFKRKRKRSDSVLWQTRGPGALYRVQEYHCNLVLFFF